MRSIDADALLAIYKGWLPQLTSQEHSGDRNGVECCIAVLEDAPTIDAAPVVHGRWDDSGRYKFTDGKTAVRCSECGCALTEEEYAAYNWNFCPVCGARWPNK